MSFDNRLSFTALVALFLVLAPNVGGRAISAEASSTSAAKAEPKGDWLQLRPDGRPYQHESTDLAWPQHLGDFDLRVGFRDKRDSAGVSLSYVNEKKDIKGDIVIYPTPTQVPSDDSVVEVMRTELARLITDTAPNATAHGYKTLSTTPAEVRGIPLWKLGQIPMLVQQGALSPIDSSKEAQTPSLSHWLGLILYQDHYIHISIVMRLDKLATDATTRNDFINAIIHCVREPAITPEMLKLCYAYMQDPLTDKSRAAADSLLTFTKESPILELVFPGEALTPSLDEMRAKASGLELDLLRAYVIGASVVNLQRGTNDEMIEEGARVLSVVYDMLKQKQGAPTIAFLEELGSAAEKQGAAAFLKPRAAAGITK
jgi:hypothetical protein